jgi:hypothetical protein
MAQLMLTGHRSGFLTIPNSAANVSPGNFTGTNAAIGQVAGTANGRSRVKLIRLSFLGLTINENWLRIYKYNSATTSFYLIRHVPIVAYNANLASRLPPPVIPISFPHDGKLDEILYSPDYKLAYQLEAVPGAPIQIEEVVADYA